MASSSSPVSIKCTVHRTFHLASDVEADNLRMLFERKRGQLFRAENGRLVVVKGPKEWLAYQWNRGAERDKVKTVVDAALRAWNATLVNESQEVVDSTVQSLFDKQGEMGIGRWSQSLYTRELVHGDNRLSKALLPDNTVRIRLGKKFHDVTYRPHEPDEKLSRDERCIDLSLGDDLANLHFLKLLERKPGERFQLGAPHERRPQKQTNKEVEGVVSDVIGKLNAVLERKDEVSNAYHYALKQIFCADGPLRRMNRFVYNRGAIKEGSTLEGILAPKLAEKRSALVGALKDLRDRGTKESKLAVEKAFMDLVVAEFEFHQRLGVDLERNGDGGSGGARYARDRFGQKILVVKPGDEGPHGLNNPQWYAKFKRLVVSPKPCLDGNSEPLAEVESWMCDRHFDIWSVPPTTMRYVVSGDFVFNEDEPLRDEDRRKLSSMQMYVADCKTLGEYLDIPSSVYKMPRTFLRWLLGSERDTGVFTPREILWQKWFDAKADKKGEVERKLPRAALERVARHNFLIEDGDCHFDNILVRVAPEGDFKELGSDEQIEEFVAHLFENKGNQALLGHLLQGERVNNQKVTLVKHDGGSSNPHSHPSRFDYLSLRYKHLFEVLPQFEQPFSSDLPQLDDKALEGFLWDKAIAGLRNILGTRVMNVNDQLRNCNIFDIFWGTDKTPLNNNQNLFREYVFTAFPDAQIEAEKRRNLVFLLVEAAGATDDEVADKLFYFNLHLIRIRGNIQTRIDSYNVLKSHQGTMRALFNGVRSEADFKNALSKVPLECRFKLSPAV